MPVSIKQKEYDIWYRKTPHGILMRKITHKRWYEKHKELAKRRAKEYQEKLKRTNPEKFREMCRRRERKFNQTPKGIYSILKTNSKMKGRELKMSVQEFTNWYISQVKQCHYCDKFQIGKRLEIDRKDNNLGYELSNIVLACEVCNGVKGKYLTEKEMLIVGQLIIKKRWQLLV